MATTFPHIYRLTAKTMRYVDEQGKLRVRPRSEAPLDPYRAEPLNSREAQFARIGLVPAECKYARARAGGWNDVVRGTGFRDAYETWPRLMQMAYERGRQQATLTQAVATRPLTIWRNDETLWGPLGRAVPHRVGARIELETRVARTHRTRNVPA